MPPRYAPWALTPAELAGALRCRPEEVLELAELGEIPHPIEVPAPGGARQYAWVQSSVAQWWTRERGAPLPAILRDPLPEDVPSLETHPAPMPAALRAPARWELNKVSAPRSVLKRTHIWNAEKQRQTGELPEAVPQVKPPKLPKKIGRPPLPWLPSEDAPPPGPMMTKAEVGRAIGARVERVLQWSQDGRIPKPAEKGGRGRPALWAASDLRAWWEENRPGEPLPRMLTG